MTNYTVKTNVSNITQLKDGTFDYNQEIVWMKWDERKGHTQSGDGPGEFGPNYSYRKQYQSWPRHDDGDKVTDHEGYEYESDRNTGRTHKD